MQFKMFFLPLLSYTDLTTCAILVVIHGGNNVYTSHVHVSYICIGRTYREQIRSRINNN